MTAASGSKGVSAERLAELYATCSSVFYAPVDEDFGMGPYEAFLSARR